MSTDDWLSSTIDARNKQKKCDRLIFITVGSLILLFVIGAFALGAWLASRIWMNQAREDQIFMACCTQAGFNQRQCDFLADRRQDERRDHVASVALGSAALGLAVSSRPLMLEPKLDGRREATVMASANPGRSS